MLDLNVKKKLAQFDLEVCLQAEKGQIIGIVGASGCGKSMLMKTIAGLESPEEGIVVCSGKVWLDTKTKQQIPVELRHAGYCFQNYALFENRTALENVMFGLEGKYRRRSLSRKERQKKAMELLEMVHLQKEAGQYPATLSGGQKQRIALARMLADQPEVCLLDEPFSAVDALTKKKLYISLKEILKQAQCPVLICSHDPRDLEALCTDWIEMDQGHIVRKGKVENETLLGF